VTFESAGGNWQKAIITDGPTGVTTAAYSLDAETSAAGPGLDRHPRIEFSCEKPGKVDNVRIRTGTLIAILANRVSDDSTGSARVSIQIDDKAIETRTVIVAKNGSDFLIRKEVVSDLLAHKRFVVRFVSVSRGEITDEYVVGGLAIKSLNADCFRSLKKK
jgi:hypothetical protein